MTSLLTDCIVPCCTIKFSQQGRSSQLCPGWLSSTNTCRIFNNKDVPPNVGMQPTAITIAYLMWGFPGASLAHNSSSTGIIHHYGFWTCPFPPMWFTFISDSLEAIFTVIPDVFPNLGDTQDWHDTMRLFHRGRAGSLEPHDYPL